MKINIIPYLLTCILIFIPDFSHSGNTIKPYAASARRYARGELLVKYKAKTENIASMRYQKSLGITTIKQFKTVKGRLIKLPGSINVEQALIIFKNDPDVKWVEPNYLRHACATPDDAFFEESWGLHNTGQEVNGSSGTDNSDIDATEAWDITTGSNSIIIAVIDSGIDYNHPDLKNNIWINEDEIPGNGIDDDANGYIDDVRGWNFTDDNNDPLDSNFHGTHVAGVIAAQGNNSTGISGVCWTVKIMALKFLDPLGSGYVSDEVSAIEYAIDNGAHIINASFGDPGISNPESEAIEKALNAGILFITAAGNTGTNIDVSPLYPASYSFSNIISVTASNQDDGLPLWGNYGSLSVDVAAPGTNIYSTIPGRITVWEDDFESDPAGEWTLEEDWARTDSESFGGDYSLTDSPGNYNNDSDTSAISPSIDLSSRANIRLNFYLKGESELNYDKLYIDTLDTSEDSDASWSSRTVEIISNSDSAEIYEEGISGRYADWVYGTVVLDHLKGVNDAYFRFRFVTDKNINYNGWYIDNVKITSKIISIDGTYPNPQRLYYGYIDGTSSATPFVSGLAGLIWSRLPDLPLCCIKEFIIGGVDQLSAFSGKTLSNGRINAYTSLNLALNQDGTSFCDCDSNDETIGSTSDGGFCFIKTCY